MHNWVSIKAADGGNFDAYLVLPANPNGGTVVCIQEIFGVNHAMRDIAQYWADQGYVAIAPDLFWRQEPHVDITDGSDEEWQKAFSLYQGFDIEKGIADLQATVAYARGLAGSNGKVGTVGFCLGGKLAYLMACRSDTNCNVFLVRRIVPGTAVCSILAARWTTEPAISDFGPLKARSTSPVSKPTRS